MNARLIRAFRRSPTAFVDALVANGATEASLPMGSERVLLLDDAREVWELLTTHARRTQKGRGLTRAKVLRAKDCSPAKARRTYATAGPCSRRSTPGR